MPHNLHVFRFATCLVRLEKSVARRGLVLAVRRRACGGEGEVSDEMREFSFVFAESVVFDQRRIEGVSNTLPRVLSNIFRHNHLHASAFCEASAQLEAPASCVTPSVCNPIARGLLARAGFSTKDESNEIYSKLFLTD
jgi:hypothetical protein